MTSSDPPTAIIDTSSLYSDRHRRAISVACNERRFIGVWSPHIIAELCRVLTLRGIERDGNTSAVRKKLSISSKAMMDILTKVLDLVDTAPTDDESPINIKDIDDHHLVRAARLSSAKYIISENTNDFPPKDSDDKHVTEGIEFIPLHKFFQRLRVEQQS